MQTYKIQIELLTRQLATGHHRLIMSVWDKPKKRWTHLVRHFIKDYQLFEALVLSAESECDKQEQNYRVTSADQLAIYLTFTVKLEKLRTFAQHANCLSELDAWLLLQTSKKYKSAFYFGQTIEKDGPWLEFKLRLQPLLDAGFTIDATSFASGLADLVDSQVKPKE